MWAVDLLYQRRYCSCQSANCGNGPTVDEFSRGRVSDACVRYRLESGKGWCVEGGGVHQQECRERKSVPQERTMKMKLVHFIFLIVFPVVTLAGPTPLEENKIEDNEIPEERGFAGDASWEMANRLLDECGERDMVTCLGVKAVAVLDRAARMTKIKLMDGVTFVKTGDADDNRNGRALMTEAEIQNSIDQDPDQKTTRLIDLFLEAATSFLQSHVLQFKMPDAATQPLQRALQETGRGKKKLIKTLLPLLLGIGLKLFALIPAGIGLVGIIAAKALIISKLALILAGIIAIQKFFGGGGMSGWNSGGGAASGWSSPSTGGWSSGGSSGGWGTSGSGSSPVYRSFGGADAHEMAYMAQLPDKQVHKCYCTTLAPEENSTSDRDENQKSTILKYTNNNVTSSTLSNIISPKTISPSDILKKLSEKCAADVKQESFICKNFRAKYYKSFVEKKSIPIVPSVNFTNNTTQENVVGTKRNIFIKSDMTNLNENIKVNQNSGNIHIYRYPTNLTDHTTQNVVSSLKNYQNTHNEAQPSSFENAKSNSNETSSNLNSITTNDLSFDTNKENGDYRAELRMGDSMEISDSSRDEVRPEDMKPSKDNWIDTLTLVRDDEDVKQVPTYSNYGDEDLSTPYHGTNEGEVQEYTNIYSTDDVGECDETSPSSRECQNSKETDAMMSWLFNTTSQYVLPYLPSDSMFENAREVVHWGSNSSSQSFQQARGKIKKLFGHMSMFFLVKAAAVFAVMLGSIKLIAGKALILSAISVVIAAVVALKKLSGGGGGKSVIVHTVGHKPWEDQGMWEGYRPGGYHRRESPDTNNLLTNYPYSAYYKPDYEMESSNGGASVPLYRAGTSLGI
ncbi:unnamed protein product [Timema podura]|uniref:Osiris 16 n=1 Tax=Timema podura TaxID=61482 RepID=A0ABN7NJE5_TIMPD|nr:unnamed protein product [Timema podura]